MTDPTEPPRRPSSAALLVQAAADGTTQVMKKVSLRRLVADDAPAAHRWGLEVLQFAGGSAIVVVTIVVGKMFQLDKLPIEIGVGFGLLCALPQVVRGGIATGTRVRDFARTLPGVPGSGGGRG